jgi:arylsulfatase A-like enzyme
VTSPEPEFQGVVGRTVGESKPAWPEPLVPPPGSPNVVLIVLDDVGFSDFGCYGSTIATPNIDALAATGLRYNNFHTTAICSSSRAAVMTGRNHHSVGMGNVSNWDTGFPGYRGRVANSAGMLSEMLKTKGYATWAAGKWHLTSLDETSAAGPYDQWPTQRGFDRFYGVFVGGNEWAPHSLVYDNHHIDTPRQPNYHFSQDIVDQSIGFLRDHISIHPEKAFFLYLCFHACHSPLHAPREFIERYKGAYDDGWDAERPKRMARQLELGIVPPDTELAPRNPNVKPWESLTPLQRRLCARLQEAYAGMLEHADTQIGRILDQLDRFAIRENTMVILVSDNGGTQEGGELGSAYYHRQLNRLPELDPEETLAALEDIGGPFTYPVYPAGWGQVSNTPLKRYKSQTHGGGVRDPLIISWPARITDRGAIRPQYHHLIDIAPTILEATTTAAPSSIRGVAQQPIEGTSMAYTFESRTEPTRKQVQYFEMFGHRGIWHDGWKAVTYHAPGSDFNDDRWELYNLDHDFSECNDLADQYPERLSELVDLWWAEATKYMVLPLDDRVAERYLVPKPKPITNRSRFVYYPGISVPTESAPDVRNVSYSITAHAERSSDSDQGVLVSCGDRTLGYAFYVQDNHLIHDYNAAGSHYTIRSTSPLPAGPVELRYEFTKTDDGTGSARLLVNGDQVGAGTIDQTLRFSFGTVALTVGFNGGTSVNESYDAPFAFTGNLDKVVFEIGDDRYVTGPTEYHDD